MPFSVTDVTDRPPLPVHSAITDRRSACPGMFRLAPALDGAICRVKLAGGRLSADQARAVAAAAARFSTAPIELTNRANFQIRAIQPFDETPLIEALMAADLGPLPSAPGLASCTIDDAALLGRDDVRNVMVSPLAGRDPQQIADITPLADRLLATLQQETRYHALSPKFAIQIDGGESVAMLRHSHDLWLSAASPDEVMIGLAGCMPVAGDADTPAGDVALAAAPLMATHELICAMLDLFLEISAPLGIMRMKQVPAELTGAAFIDRLQQRLRFSLRRDAEVTSWRRRAAARNGHLGIIAEREAGHVSIGAMPALGRITATQLTAMADLAAQFGDGSLRLTPWQSVIVPSAAADAAADVVREIAAIGLFSDATMPFAQMIACTGSAGCASGLAATQADGVALGGLLAARNIAFPTHLSGCSKSCAAMRTEPATLVAVAPGHYDLYRREAKASSRFGQKLAENITLDEAASILADLAASEKPAR
jgi:precorrin-3B synthase